MFHNVVMLAGLGGAVVPLIIHLLNRARYQTADFGAMMFLHPANVPQQHVGRLREWSLLAVRMLLVALLAMALARPAGGRDAPAATETGRITAAIIVDTSPSMSHADGGVTRVAAARSAVLRVLSTLRRGDQIALMTSAAPTPFTGDLQALAARVSELRPTAVAVDFATAVTAAVEALEQQPPAGEKRLYLICDRQAAGWAGADALGADLRRRLRAIGASFAVVTVGAASAENISIDAIAIVNPPAIAGNIVPVEVRLHNHGSSPRLGVPLTLRLDERDEQSATVNLPAGQSAGVTLPIRFPASGPRVLSAEIARAGGDLDDRRASVINVADPIAALLVRDAARDDAEIDYLRAALTPFSMSGREGGDAAKLDMVASDDLDEQSLDRYRVVILDDVATLDPPQARALEQFVYAGGGLLIAPGPAAQTNEYNRLLYREDTGLLPALLQPAATPPQPQRIDPASVDTAHPLMRFLPEHPPAVAGAFDRFFPVTGRTAQARSLALLSSGDALIIESTFGAGRVLLFTCPLDTRWSSLPLTNVYLPMVQSALRYVSGINSSPYNVTAGQQWRMRFATTRPSGARAIVIRPDGSRDQAEVTDLEGQTEIRYADTRLPGVYAVRLGQRGGEQVARFAVAPSPDESDLTPLSEQRWVELATQLGFERFDDVLAIGAGKGAAIAGGEWWFGMLLGVIGLLVIEMALTAAWGRRR